MARYGEKKQKFLLISVFNGLLPLQDDQGQAAIIGIILARLGEKRNNSIVGTRYLPLPLPRISVLKLSFDKIR